MTCIKESSSCGAGCGVGCSSLMVVVSFLYSMLCLVYTLITRLYLQGFYTSAHVAALSVVLGIFVFLHHTFYKAQRWCLCMSNFGFYLLHSILNIIYLLLCLAHAISYSLVMSKGITGTINFDNMTATILSWMNFLLMFYLMVVSLSMLCHGDTESYQLSSNGFTVSSDPIIAYESADGINMQPMNDTAQYNNSKSKKTTRCCSLQCCVGVFFWFFYLLFHLIFLFFVSFSVYHASGVYHDIITFRAQIDQHMHVVTVANHRPIAMHFECMGNGTETVVYENGLGTSLWASRPFVPKVLSEKYTVCVYDRRGYGWSDTIESDFADSYIKFPQRAKTNVDFLKALVDKTNISVPFYYAGHSYGGIHLLYMAKKYPEYIKGLIFLDSSTVELDYNYGLNLGEVQRIMEVVSNFKATGLLRLVLDHELYDIYKAFSSVVNLRDLPKPALKQLLATSKSGAFFETFVREKKQIRIPKTEREMFQDFKGYNITMPALVVWAGSEGSLDGLPRLLALNETTDVHVVHGSSHTSLVMSYEYANITSSYIEDFITRNSNQT